MLLFIQARPTSFLSRVGPRATRPLRPPTPPTCQAPLVSDTAPPHCANMSCHPRAPWLGRAGHCRAARAVPHRSGPGPPARALMPSTRRPIPRPPPHPCLTPTPFKRGRPTPLLLGPLPLLRPHSEAPHGQNPPPRCFPNRPHHRSTAPHREFSHATDVVPSPRWELPLRSLLPITPIQARPYLSLTLTEPQDHAGQAASAGGRRSKWASAHRSAAGAPEGPQPWAGFSPFLFPFYLIIPEIVWNFEIQERLVGMSKNYKINFVGMLRIPSTQWAWINSHLCSILWYKIPRTQILK
jgi:hypothetical protein